MSYVLPVVMRRHSCTVDGDGATSALCSAQCQSMAGGMMWSGTGLYSTHIGQKGTVGGTLPGGHLIFRKVGTFMGGAAILGTNTLGNTKSRKRDKECDTAALHLIRSQRARKLYCRLGKALTNFRRIIQYFGASLSRQAAPQKTSLCVCAAVVRHS